MAESTQRRTGLMAYIAGVILAFPVTLLLIPFHGIPASPLLVAALAGIGFLAGAKPVRIPGMRHEIQATHPFILLALAVAGLHVAVMVAVAGVLGAMLGRPGRPALTKLAFNVSAVGLSTTAAGAVFAAGGGEAGLSLTPLLLPMFAATAVYMFCNTGFVAIVIALDKAQSVIKSWYVAFSYTLVSYFAGLTIAVAMVAVESRVLPWGLLLAAASYPMLLAFYRNHASAMSPEKPR